MEEKVEKANLLLIKNTVRDLKRILDMPITGNDKSLLYSQVMNRIDRLFSFNVNIDTKEIRNKLNLNSIADKAFDYLDDPTPAKKALLDTEFTTFDTNVAGIDVSTVTNLEQFEALSKVYEEMLDSYKKTCALYDEGKTFYELVRGQYEGCFGVYRKLNGFPDVSDDLKKALKLPAFKNQKAEELTFGNFSSRFEKYKALLTGFEGEKYAEYVALRASYDNGEISIEEYYHRVKDYLLLERTLREKAKALEEERALKHDGYKRKDEALTPADKADIRSTHDLIRSDFKSYYDNELKTYNEKLTAYIKALEDYASGIVTDFSVLVAAKAAFENAEKVARDRYASLVAYEPGNYDLDELFRLEKRKMYLSIDPPDTLDDATRAYIAEIDKKIAEAEAIKTSTAIAKPDRKVSFKTATKAYERPPKAEAEAEAGTEAEAEAGTEAEAEAGADAGAEAGAEAESEDEMVTVSFVNGSSFIPGFKELKVKKGKPFHGPAIPPVFLDKNGKPKKVTSQVFDHWEDLDGNVIDLSSGVTKNTTLVAKFKRSFKKAASIGLGIGLGVLGAMCTLGAGGLAPLAGVIGFRIASRIHNKRLNNLIKENEEAAKDISITDEIPEDLQKNIDKARRLGYLNPFLRTSTIACEVALGIQAVVGIADAMNVVSGTGLNNITQSTSVLGRFEPNSHVYRTANDALTGVNGLNPYKPAYSGRETFRALFNGKWTDIYEGQSIDTILKTVGATDASKVPVVVMNDSGVPLTWQSLKTLSR